MAIFRVAEVRNWKDETQSGHCQVRVYNKQNDEQKTKDEDLAWAIPCMPMTSASTAGVGVMPTGPVVGTRVLITYLEDDVEQQYPIMIGTLGRAKLPSVDGVRTEPDEESGGQIPPEEGGADQPLGPAGNRTAG